MFCEYRHIFGKEGEGVHSYRIFGIAAVDLILTIIAAVLISWYTQKNVVIVFAILMILAVFLHWLFCVKTRTNELLGLN